jgi:hypothetical protein
MTSKAGEGEHTGCLSRMNKMLLIICIKTQGGKKSKAFKE